MVTASALVRLVKIFQHVSGCYLLGAGASSGIVPFGHALTNAVVQDYANGSMWPVEMVRQDALAKRINHMHRYRGPVLTEDGEMWNWKLDRLPSSYARLHLFNALAYPMYYNAAPINYLAFLAFHPSAIINYNLDGLASRWCSRRHVVLNPHGTVLPGFGAYFWREFLPHVRNCDSDLQLLADCYSVLFERESDGDPLLLSILEEQALTALRSCSFVAIIGYSFARVGEAHDDWLSLELFTESMRKYGKPIYILDPQPTFLTEVLREEIKTKRIYPFEIYWNVLAKAICCDKENFAHLFRRYQLELDRA